MIVAGIDVGSLTAKAVVLGDDEVYSYSLRPTGTDIPKVARCSRQLEDFFGKSFSGKMHRIV